MRFCFTVLFMLLSVSLRAESPNEVLKMLIAGNDRFCKGKRLARDLLQERENTVDGQSPWAVVLCCSDARTCPEIIFDQGLGALFVVRVAGNVAGAFQTDSIEYAIDILGASLIVVMGHSDCGAIQAVLDNEAVKDHLSHIAPYLRPSAEVAKKKEKEPLEFASILNVKAVCESLKKQPVISNLLSENKVQIVEAYYDLTTGKVRLLNE